MFQQIPHPISQTIPANFNPISSPTSRAFPPLQPRVVTVSSSPQRQFSLASLKSVKTQNDNCLDLISEQLKLVSALSEAPDVDLFKTKVASVLSNLQGMMEYLLKSNKALHEVFDPSEFKIPEKIQEKTEECCSNLVEENNKLKKENEALLKEAEKKDAQIEELNNIIIENKKEIEKSRVTFQEKEKIEKNLEKLVILHDQVSKTFDEKVIELDANKSKCNVLMDINGELRESIEILLHENNKLNRILTGEFKKLNEEEEEQD